MDYEDLYEEMMMYVPLDMDRVVKIVQEDPYGMRAYYDDGSSLLYDATIKGTRYTRAPKDYPDTVTSDDIWRAEFARRLNRWLDIKHVSKKRLSEMTGISYPSISKYATGQVEPTARNLRLIAQALMCSADALIGF